MQAKQLEFPLNTSPEDSMYLGLSHQNLDFHQALAELIDNAMSAQTQGFFTVEVHLTKDSDRIYLVVADNGSGISLTDLQERVMRLGGRGQRLGRLNEHGYGLKNSLCRLTGNQLPWEILTRDSAALPSTYYRVPGPFRHGMVAYADNGAKWNKDILKAHGETGTRVFVQTSFEYFRTLYRRAEHFDRLIERLLEHLGVIYRGYLSDRRNTLWVRWRTSPQDTWNDDLVQPIEIPYGESQTRDIKVTVGGKQAIVKYTWGWIDEEKRDRTTGRLYPLRIYYQVAYRTQGIDIRLRGRVIHPHAIEVIWPEIARHPSLNKFAGELVIDSEEFSSVNNKTTLDEQNPFWQALKEKLQASDLQPREFASLRRQDEEAVKTALKTQLPHLVPRSTAELDFVTWPGMGVKIDLLHILQSGEEHVYEIKARELTPADVYQLIMYWDGRVVDGLPPKLGRLIGVSEPPTSVREMIQYWNKRKDANGNLYRLEVKTSKELLGDISPPTLIPKRSRKAAPRR